jgi:hypothetical protein
MRQSLLKIMLTHPAKDCFFVLLTGSILQNSISDENFSRKFSSSNFGQISTRDNNICRFGIWIYHGIMDNNLQFYGILKPSKDNFDQIMFHP